jgi:hypothetical protein
MAAKRRHGSLLPRLFSREQAVVVRLEPVEASGALAGDHAGAGTRHS